MMVTFHQVGIQLRAYYLQYFAVIGGSHEDSSH